MIRAVWSCETQGMDLGENLELEAKAVSPERTRGRVDDGQRSVVTVA